MLKPMDNNKNKNDHKGSNTGKRNYYMKINH